MFELFRGNFALVLISLVFVLIYALDGIVYPYFAGALADHLAQERFEELPYLLGFWLIMWIVLAIGGIGQGYFFGKLRKRINVRLKDKLFSRSYEKSSRNISADKFYAQITADTKQVETDFVNNILTFVFCILQSVITFIFLMTIDWKVGLVFVLLGAIPSLLPLFTSKWLQRSATKWQDHNHNYLNYMNEGLNGRTLIRRFNAIRYIKEETLKLLEQEQSKYFWMNFKRVLSEHLVFFVYSFTMIGSIAFGALQVYEGSLTVGLLITIMMAADRVTAPLIALANMYNSMTAMVPMLKNILYGKESEEKYIEPKFKNIGSSFVQLKNVSIGYNQPLIEDFNLSIDPKDKILIQGSSGTGKSTLIRTIMNELEPLRGDIYYHEQLNEDIVLNFSVVEQKPFIFNQSIRFNLLLGQDLSDDTLIKILNEVGLEKYANNEGLELIIGHDNQNLSGGEMKRLEVARAIAYGKEILVVDEALSGLDYTSAKRLNDLIMKFPGTVINIEHHITEELKSNYNKFIVL